MRRKIELYIDGALADLNDQALVLFNYALTDLQKPTAVKNSYSKQITLPGTPANDAIFSHAYRLDKMVGVSGFDPLTRTPFAIYDEKGDIVESGYLKLDKVSRKKGDHTYAVTLYGGLGSFFYALSYRSDGEKKTLADLKYLGPGIAFDDELDFTMTAANVESNWVLLADGTIGPITFVPAYEGKPDGDFDAGKAVATMASVGLTSQTESGVTYGGQNGGTIINLAAEIDEWAAKDLRCYLQRPALKVAALLEALSNSTYNGGYTLDHSGIDALVADLWITLPSLTSLQGVTQETETYTYTSKSASGNQLWSKGAPSGAVIAALSECKVTAGVQFVANFAETILNGVPVYYFQGNLDPEYDGSQYYHDNRAAWFLQFVAYSADGAVVGGSKVFVYKMDSENVNYNETLEGLASLCNYTPLYNAGYEAAQLFASGWAAKSLTSVYKEATFTCRGAAKVVAVLRCFLLDDRYMAGDSSVYRVSTQGGGKYPVLVKSTQTGAYTYSHSYATAHSISIAVSSCSVKVTTSSQVRSGTLLKKTDLLTTQYTPAEYLVSLAKAFGWLFLADQKSKKITILSRDDFYNYGGDSVDLTERIDRSQEILVTPAYAGSKWYDLRYQEGGGAFYDNYKDRYGVQYGIQRVNTGYDFDSQPENIMDGIIFREAVAALDYGQFWNIITEGTQYKPSVFLESGHTYTLFASDGSTKDFSVSRPSSAASVAYFNASHPGYDIEGADKLELRDADGKAVAGENILVWYRGQKGYQKVKVSDDSTLMVLLNEGRPCWDLNPGVGTTYVPIFSRFKVAGTQITRSLEFGDVRELAIPDLTLGTDTSLYAAKWKKYLGDLLSEDTKVLTCKVHLDGLEVGPELLRRFFWYEGSYWVLNKINNYSLTTYDPAECEFVQVQDTDNYTDGQLW